MNKNKAQEIENSSTIPGTDDRECLKTAYKKGFMDGSDAVKSKLMLIISTIDETNAQLNSMTEKEK